MPDPQQLYVCMETPVGYALRATSKRAIDRLMSMQQTSMMRRGLPYVRLSRPALGDKGYWAKRGIH